MYKIFTIFLISIVSAIPAFGVDSTTGGGPNPGFSSTVDDGVSFDKDSDGTAEWSIDEDGNADLGSVTMGSVYLELTTDTTLTDAQVKRLVITNRAQSAEQYTKLPAFVGVTDVSFEVVTASQEWDLLPPTDEAFKLDGTDLTVNFEIQMGAVAGDGLVCRRIRIGASNYQWWCRTVDGTHIGQEAD